jgi:hypothetical protein
MNTDFFMNFSSSFNLITPAEKHLLEQVENYFQKPIVEFSEKYFADDELYKI